MKKVLFSILAVTTILTLSAPISWAWEKDQGISCERVFASIQNDGLSRNWDGVVNANGVDVVNTSGSDASTNFVTVEWIPTPGFSGPVNATITLSDAEQSVGESNTVSGDLDCPQPSPTITPTITPTPTQTTNTGGPGDGLSDGRSDGRSDGKSTPIQAVLGLSTTSGNNGLIVFAQIVAAFALSIVAYKFLKKNA